MLKLKDLLRRVLARWGYLVVRIEPAISPGIAGYLRALRSRTALPISVVCFDHEIRIQYAILDAIPKENVAFVSPILVSKSRKREHGATLPPSPREPFLVVIDIGASPIESLLAELPWLIRADAILLRQQTGSFWSGDSDLTAISAQMDKHHFAFTDVIDFSIAPLLESSSMRLTLVYERKANAEPESVLQRYRTNEALTCLSPPIATRRAFRMLAARGSFGYTAGVLNPGAVVDGDRILLLCRTEHTHWGLMKNDELAFFAPSPPLLLDLQNDESVGNAVELGLDGPFAHDNTRMEDFRMFRFRDEIFCNHAVISGTHGGNGNRGGLRLGATRTRVGISKLEIAERRLVWRGFPALDRPLAKTEKNWAVFTDGDRLFLLYSFSPYILLASDDWPGLKFSTIRERAVARGFNGDGLPLRNSINPVDYDSSHWLHLVHKVHPDKRYSFWPVLIDKQSLLPAKMSERPLLRGGSSAPSSMIYACSAVTRSDDVLVFGGIDDCAAGMWRVRRAELDRHWASVA